MKEPAHDCFAAVSACTVKSSIATCHACVVQSKANPLATRMRCIHKTDNNVAPVRENRYQAHNVNHGGHWRSLYCILVTIVSPDKLACNSVAVDT